MNIFELPIERPLTYMVTGKFEAPSANWIHEDFPLTDYELIVMTEGILYLSYQNIKYTVTEGEYLLLPPGLPPDNRRVGFQPSACSFYWLHFASQDTSKNPPPGTSPEAISDAAPYQFPVAKNSIFLPQHGAIPSPEKVLVLMRQLQDGVKSHYGQTILNYMTTTILCEVYSQFCALHNQLPAEKRTHKQLYYDMIDYIKENTGRSLKVMDVAAHFGYNEKYLSHMFHQLSGISLKQYILKTKMDTANFMLTDTNAPILEIALALGFTDSHNFSKAYKKVNGLTPSEYRNAFSKRLLFHR